MRLFQAFYVYEGHHWISAALTILRRRKEFQLTFLSEHTLATLVPIYRQ